MKEEKRRGELTVKIYASLREAKTDLCIVIYREWLETGRME
jgi:hypothetical protein